MFIEVVYCLHAVCVLIVMRIPVYPDGRVCISILHPPGDDPNGYELASERWMPVHTVCDTSRGLLLMFVLVSLNISYGLLNIVDQHFLNVF